MHEQHSDIDFQMIEVSVRLAAVHGEAHFVTAWINVYPVGPLWSRPPKIRSLAACLRSCSRSPRSGWTSRRSRRCSSRSRAVAEPRHGALFRELSLRVAPRHDRRLPAPGEVHLDQGGPGGGQALRTSHAQAVSAGPPVHPGVPGAADDGATDAPLSQAFAPQPAPPCRRPGNARPRPAWRRRPPTSRGHRVPLNTPLSRHRSPGAPNARTPARPARTPGACSSP